MDFVEEITPRGLTIKILFNKWKFLVFDKRGNSIYPDKEKKSPLFHIPLIFFIGKNFETIRDYHKDYYLLKVRNDSMILPYYSVKESKISYFFIKCEKDIDLIPVRITGFKNIAEILKKVESKSQIDLLIIDDTITPNDIVILKNRYKIDDFLNSKKIFKPYKKDAEEPEGNSAPLNINLLSENPVFLSIFHLKNLDFSKVNQLLLDFELTALETEYILNFIKKLINKEDIAEKDKEKAQNLQEYYKFYHYLIQKDTTNVEEMINQINSRKKIPSYRTLISKAKSIFPGKEEQLLYTEYENLLIEKRDLL